MIEATDTLAFMGGRLRFDRLTLVRELRPKSLYRDDGRRFVRLGLFKCECGAQKTAELRNVRRGLTRSCGCLRKRSKP